MKKTLKIDEVPMTDIDAYFREKIQERHDAAKQGLDTIKGLVDGNNFNEDSLSCVSLTLKRIYDELCYLAGFLNRSIDDDNRGDKK